MLCMNYHTLSYVDHQMMVGSGLFSSRGKDLILSILRAVKAFSRAGKIERKVLSTARSCAVCSSFQFSRAGCFICAKP